MSKKDLEPQTMSSDWNDTGRTISIMGINGYFIFPVMLFVLHITWWTFFLMIAVILVMIIMQMRGMSPHIFYLFMRTKLAGRIVKRRASLGSKLLNK